jgi:hypothetical protein
MPASSSVASGWTAAPGAHGISHRRFMGPVTAAAGDAGPVRSPIDENAAELRLLGDLEVVREKEMAVGLGIA